MKKKYICLFLALVAALLLMSACSQSGTGSGNSPSALDVLQKSVNTMKQLKSSHVDLQSSSTTQATGTDGKASNLTATVKGNGDEQLPNEQLNLNVSAAGVQTNLAEVVQGNNVYIKNSKGQWYVINKNNLTGSVANPFSGVSIDQNTLLGLLAHANVTDHGTETLNGQSDLRHITADLDKEAVKQLLKDDPQLATNIGQQNIDTVLNNTKSFSSSIDVWISQKDFYVHRSEFKLNLNINANGVAATANGTPTTQVASNVKTSVDIIADLSKFNVPVTITPPANAIPTNDITTALGVNTQ